jgi:hypothetical protein
MSAAVMPMRKTVSAQAIRGSAAKIPTATITAANARPFADFPVRIASNPSLDSR